MATYSRDNSSGQTVLAIQQSLNAIFFNIRPNQPGIDYSKGGIQVSAIFDARTEYVVLAAQKAYNKAYFNITSPPPAQEIDIPVRQATTTQTSISTTAHVGPLTVVYRDEEFDEDMGENGEWIIYYVLADSEGNEKESEASSSNKQVADRMAYARTQAKFAFPNTPDELLPPEPAEPPAEAPPSYSNDQVTEAQFENGVSFFTDLINDVQAGVLNITLPEAELNEDGVVDPDTLAVLGVSEPPVKEPDTLRYTGRVSDSQNIRIPGVEVTVDSETAITDENGSFTLDLAGTVDPTGVNVTFDNPDYFTKSVSNVLQSSQEEINGEIIYIFDLGKVSLSETKVDTAQFTDQVLVDVQSAENREIAIGYKSGLSLSARLGIVLNKGKEQLKRLMIPFILGLLAKFGPKFLDAVLKRLPNPQPDFCPSSDELIKIIKKRNKLVKQINNIYNVVKVVEKVLKTVRGIVTGLKIGFRLATLLPTPPFAPSGLVADVVSFIKRELDKIGIGVNFLIVIAVVIGILLQTLLDLLNRLDAAIEGCAQNQLVNVSFDSINKELNALSDEVSQNLNRRGSGVQGASDLNRRKGKKKHKKDAKAFLADAKKLGGRSEIGEGPGTGQGQGAGSQDEEQLFDENGNLNPNALVPGDLEGGEQAALNALANDIQNLFPGPGGGDAIQDILSSIGNQSNIGSAGGGGGNSANENLGGPNEVSSGNTFRGFTFEIKFDPKSNSKYPKRFAEALNIQGVPVLKSDSSFASNPQVLIDQLKFVIESQNLRGD